MLAVLATLVAACLAQAPRVDWRLPPLFPSCGPAERTVELDALDPVLPDRGRCEEFRYAALWDVTIEVAATTEEAGLGLFLELEDGTDGTLHRDEAGEGGSECRLLLRLESGRSARLRVGAVDPDARGRVALRATETPELDRWADSKELLVPRPPCAALAAVLARVRPRFEEIAAGTGGPDFEATRRTLRELGDELYAAEGAAESVEVAELAELIAVESFELGDSRGGLPLAEKVLSFRERALHEKFEQLHGARLNLATLCTELGDLGRARTLEERVVATIERMATPDLELLQQARLSLAETITHQGDLAGARALEEAALAALERTARPDDAALQRARQNLAATLRELGELDGARRLLDAAAAASADPMSDLKLQRARATLLYESGNLAEARAIWERVLSILEQRHPDDHPDLQRVRFNLAAALHSLGEFTAARTLFERVLSIEERILPPDAPRLQYSRMGLALALSRAGDHAGAFYLEQQVLENFGATLPTGHPHLQTARMNLALSLRELGRLDASRRLLEMVLAEQEHALPSGHPDLVGARVNVAGARIRGRDFAGARVLLERTLADGVEALPPDHPDLLAARMDLGYALDELGELARARELYEAVLAAAERSGTVERTRWITTRSNLLSTLRALGDERSEQRELATLVAQLEERFEAARLHAPREAAAMLASLQLPLSASLSHVLAEDGPLRARLFRLVETQRALAALDRGTCPAPDGEPADVVALRQRLAALHARVAQRAGVTALPDASPAPRDGDLGQVVRERDAAERELRAALAAAGQSPAALDAAALAAALAPGQVLVGYFAYLRSEIEAGPERRTKVDDALLAHVLHVDGTLVRVELGPLAAIESLVTRWRTAIGRGPGPERGFGEIAPIVGDAAALGAELRRRVFDPVLGASGNARTLHVCVDDVLHLVPLDALPLDGPGGRLVGDERRIRLETSASALRRGRPLGPDPASPKLLAVGGIDYAAPDGTAPAFLPLDATRDEAERIAAAHRLAFGIEPVVLLGTAATKESLREQVRSARFVHVATHGCIAPESARSLFDRDETGGARASAPGRFAALGAGADVVRGLAPLTLCGIALAGANRGVDSIGRIPGILTAEELAGLDLSRCELAVLSACDTNVGARRAGLGIQSLQAALHAAGARTAVTSLWKVADEPTRFLMEDFYRRLWIGKEGKAEALWNAKRAARARGAPLGDWAGWVLTGDPE